MLSPLYNIVKKVNNLEHKHKGIVVENNDSDKKGRIKCFIPNLIPNASTDLLPWCYPKKSSGQGGSPDTGYFSVPEIGSVVEISFPEKDIYFPVYGDIVNSTDIKQPLFDIDYPLEYGGSDPTGSFFRVNKKQGKIEVIHNPSDTILTLDKEGNIYVKNKGNLIWDIGKDCLLNITGNLQVNSENLHIKNTDVLNIESTDVNINNSGNSKLESSGNILLKGDKVGIDGAGDVSTKSGGKLSLKGGSSLVGQASNIEMKASAAIAMTATAAFKIAAASLNSTPPILMSPVTPYPPGSSLGLSASDPVSVSITNLVDLDTHISTIEDLLNSLKETAEDMRNSGAVYRKETITGYLKDSSTPNLLLNTAFTNLSTTDTNADTAADSIETTADASIAEEGGMGETHASVVSLNSLLSPDDEEFTTQEYTNVQEIIRRTTNATPIIVGLPALSPLPEESFFNFTKIKNTFISIKGKVDSHRAIVDEIKNLQNLKNLPSNFLANKTAELLAIKNEYLSDITDLKNKLTTKKAEILLDILGLDDILSVTRNFINPTTVLTDLESYKTSLASLNLNIDITILNVEVFEANISLSGVQVDTIISDLSEVVSKLKVDKLNSIL